jgi:hypothetical protein
MEFLIALQRAINEAIGSDLSAFAATRDSPALLAVLPLGAIHAA